MCKLGSTGIIQLQNSQKIGYGRNEETEERYKIVQSSKCRIKYRQYTIISHELEEYNDT